MRAPCSHRESLAPAVHTARSAWWLSKIRGALFVTGVMLALLALAACPGSPPGAPSSASVTPHVLAQGEVAQHLELAGVVVPQTIVDVGAQTSGQISKMTVKLGEEVEAGQLLAEIDPVLARSDYDASVAGLKVLRIQHDSAELQLQHARENLARLESLYNKRLTSEREYRDAVLAERVQALNVHALEAQILQSESVITKTRKALTLTTLSAPISATVVAVLMNPGQTVIASQQAPVILKLANLKKMTGKVYVPEADVDKIRPGMPLSFDVSGNADGRHQAAITLVSPVPEKVQGVNFYVAQFDIDNADRLFKVEMSLRVRVRLDPLKGLALPLAYVRRDPAGQAQVFRINGDKGEWVSIQTGTGNAEHVLVTSGLQAGDRVLSVAQAIAQGY